MKVLVTEKHKYHPTVDRIYKKNFGETNTTYSSILQSGADFWFDLTNSKRQIVASCNIWFDSPTPKCGCGYTKSKHLIYLADVFVPEKFRGNHYAYKLIKFVCLFAEQNFKHAFDGIYLNVENGNIPAIKTYEKLFHLCCMSPKLSIYSRLFSNLD